MSKESTHILMYEKKQRIKSKLLERVSALTQRRTHTHYTHTHTQIHDRKSCWDDKHPQQANVLLFIFSVKDNSLVTNDQSLFIRTRGHILHGFFTFVATLSMVILETFKLSHDRVTHRQQGEKLFLFPPPQTDATIAHNTQKKKNKTKR